MTTRPKKAYTKEKTTEKPVLQLVRERWSPCVYSDEPVDPKDLATLFEAARWAPSCYNEQPWSFVLGIGGETHQKLLSCLVEPNREWAQHAPVLGFSVAHLTFEKNGKPNRHAYHDVGLTMGILCLQAVELGLSVHQMAGFDVEAARAACNLPENYDPVAAFAIGYTADPAIGPENLTQRDVAESKRREQSSFLFDGEWGKTL